MNFYGPSETELKDALKAIIDPHYASSIARAHAICYAVKLHISAGNAPGLYRIAVRYRDDEIDSRQGIRLEEIEEHAFELLRRGIDVSMRLAKAVDRAADHVKPELVAYLGIEEKEPKPEVNVFPDLEAKVH